MSNSKSPWGFSWRFRGPVIEFAHLPPAGEPLRGMLPGWIKAFPSSIFCYPLSVSRYVLEFNCFELIVAYLWFYRSVCLGRDSAKHHLFFFLFLLSKTTLDHMDGDTHHLERVKVSSTDLGCSFHSIFLEGIFFIYFKNFQWKLGVRRLGWTSRVCPTRACTRRMLGARVQDPMQLWSLSPEGTPFKPDIIQHHNRPGQPSRCTWVACPIQLFVF